MNLRLNNSQYRALSNLSCNAAAIFLASVVLPGILGGVDFSKLPVLIFGVGLTIVMGILTLEFAKKGKL